MIPEKGKHINIDNHEINNSNDLEKYEKIIEAEKRKLELFPFNHNSMFDICNKENFKNIENERFFKDICKFQVQVFTRINKPNYKRDNIPFNWKDKIFDEDSIIKNKPIDDFFICCICSNIAIDPVKCSHCEKLNCNSCIEDWLKRNPNQNCISCRNEYKKLDIGRNEMNIIKNIILKCPFDCEVVFPYEKLDKHISNDCEKIRKKFTCDLCYESFIVENNCQDEITIHDNNCKKIKYECSNCSKHLSLDCIDDHKLKCKEKIRSCKKCSVNYFEKYSSAHDNFYCERISKLIIIITSLISLLN